MQTNDGHVLKPVQSPPRGEREHNFFKRIFSSNEHILSEDEKELKMLVPTYKGSFIHNESIIQKLSYYEYNYRIKIFIFFISYLY